ncbi:class II aldolase/adducin family protein [Acidisoma cellulosilytica]|uniref:Class II aldolase/adducin family protein n=1 Tax=Acidisoma cellulosilyticum TaxID=2802395 RepID=A0A963Z6M6_9PROT|nr:class II aldolase/adducin family protein [Acidisoma cellulosilyticum]MCB8883777.1 class II aldolase/adducin family protein [Acidisoma cellulosilyticum]
MSLSIGDVAWTYREMGRLGLNFGSAGNVSRRHGARMLITPSGATTDGILDAAVVEMTFQGEVTRGDVPSSEWAMHAAIYEAYPQAGAIIHSHADACTALACLREPLPPFHYMVAGFGGDDVRCTPYTTFGTKALADLAVEALRDRTACLLGNHGMTCHGRDLKAALSAAVRLETLARQYMLARSVKTPQLLNPDELLAARERYRSYGQSAAQESAA